MKNTPTELSPPVLACVAFACLLGLALILAIPMESLALELVYQGF